MDASSLEKYCGSGSIDETVGFFKELCRAYREVDAAQRQVIRDAIRRNKHLSDALLYDTNAAVGGGTYLQAISDAVETENYESYLVEVLTVASMTNGFGDPRDTLVWLDGIWHNAEKNEIDPKSHFEVAANLSDATEYLDPMFGGSTKGLILQCIRYSSRSGGRRHAAESTDQDMEATGGPGRKRTAWWKFW